MARKNIDFEGMIANGGATGKKRMFGPDTPAPPGGFRAATVNGTAEYMGVGWNQTEDWPEWPAQERGPWTSDGNRTGE